MQWIYVKKVILRLDKNSLFQYQGYDYSPKLPPIDVFFALSIDVVFESGEAKEDSYDGYSKISVRLSLKEMFN